MALFVMPKLGADMSEGKIIAWRKKEGDRVARGEIIADVETDKADIEVEVFTTGVLERLLVQEGEKVPIGTPLAIIREEGKPVEAEEVEEAKASLPKPFQPAPATPALTARPSESGRIRISPVARKLAEEIGIDTATITGTGPGGRITREDIERAARQQSPAEAVLDRQTRMRQAIAAAMARSKREIPHYYLSTAIDMSRAMKWLAEENLRRPVEDRLLYGVLLIKAVALALREAPELNSIWADGKLVEKSDIHIGVAISLRGGGLVAPALHNTDRQSLDELMKNFRDLVGRARAGTLRASEVSDPTITVTSLGEMGVETVFGIIYPPQTALVGFGKIVERPWVVEGQVAVRHIVNASLSADHRVSDGHKGGLFLAAVDRLLQKPESL
ncbi:MAG TPA: dihydrolipoamide acetyltransferase family protein [Blastocatellia bacterium]|jgi:pyruvate dehydrogenase E2 component (dihydrolipoamide acetyltransferase)